MHGFHWGTINATTCVSLFYLEFLRPGRRRSKQHESHLVTRKKIFKKLTVEKVIARQSSLLLQYYYGRQNWCGKRKVRTPPAIHGGSDDGQRPFWDAKKKTTHGSRLLHLGITPQPGATLRHRVIGAMIQSLLVVVVVVAVAAAIVILVRK
jgi:hypothetical protein